MIDEFFVENVLGCRARCLSRGDGQPIIMISGWLGTAGNFVPLMESFPDGFRCIAVDLPGLGKTTHFKDRPHTVENFALFIDDLIKKMGLENPTVLGISLGASVALDYTIIEDETPKRAIIQSPVYKPISINRRAALGLWLLDHLRPLTHLVLQLCGKPIFHRVIMFFGDKNIKSISFETLSKYGTLELPYYNIPAMVEAVRDVLSVNFENSLGRPKGNILLLVGSEENLFSPNYEQDLASKLPNCKFEIFEGGTHFLLLQKPDLMLEKILNFLKLP